MMKVLFCALAISLIAPMPARAEVQAGTGPLILNVHPSGVENPAAEAQARKERLERQMRRNEFLFRSICTRCSNRPDLFRSDAPFDPAAALSDRTSRSAQTEPPQETEE